jgi:nucleoside-diphosphate-sugar epimerase
VKIAVTGGSGFIGARIVADIESRGDEAVVIDSEHGIDILGDKLEEALAPCDAVIHCAGVLGTEELFAKMETAVMVNVLGTTRILELCLKHDVSYTAISLPFAFESVYRATKECAYNFAMYMHKYKGLKV